MSVTEQIDGTTVVRTYFEDRIAEAEKKVEEARAALAAAEAKVEQRQDERDTFVKDGTLPPGVPNTMTLSPEWDLCQWAQSRVAAVSWTDMTPAGDAVFARREAEAAATHTWLREHGYTVPAPFGEQA